MIGTVPNVDAEVYFEGFYGASGEEQAAILKANEEDFVAHFGINYYTLYSNFVETFGSLQGVVLPEMEPVLDIIRNFNEYVSTDEYGVQGVFDDYAAVCNTVIQAIADEYSGDIDWGYVETCFPQIAEKFEYTNSDDDVKREWMGVAPASFTSDALAAAMQRTWVEEQPLFSSLMPEPSLPKQAAMLDEMGVELSVLSPYEILCVAAYIDSVINPAESSADNIPLIYREYDMLQKLVYDGEQIYNAYTTWNYENIINQKDLLPPIYVDEYMAEKAKAGQVWDNLSLKVAQTSASIAATTLIFYLFGLKADIQNQGYQTKGQVLLNNIATAMENNDTAMLKKLGIQASRLASDVITSCQISAEDAQNLKLLMDQLDIVAQGVQAQNGEILVPEIPGIDSLQALVTAEQLESAVQASIEENIQANPEGVQLALTEGITALTNIESRVKSDSGNINHEGIGIDEIHDAYMSYARGQIGIRSIAPATAESIKTVMQAQTLTQVEMNQLTSALTGIIGSVELAEAYVEQAVAAGSPGDDPENGGNAEGSAPAVDDIVPLDDRDIVPLDNMDDGTVPNMDAEEENGYNVGNSGKTDFMSVGNTTAETNSAKSNIIDYTKISEDLGKRLAAEGYTIIDVETAEQANTDWADMGFDKLPIASGTYVFNVKAGSNSYSRVYCEGYNNPKSRFILRTDDIREMTAKEIYDKYALPKMPNKVVHLEIPENILLEVSIVGPQDFNGQKTNGGDIQYAIKDTELIDEWFSNIEDLK